MILVQDRAALSINQTSNFENMQARRLRDRMFWRSVQTFVTERREMLNRFPAVQSALHEVASDNRSGAAEILTRSARIFSLLQATNIKDARAAVIGVCAELIEAQPDMAPLANLANAVARVVMNLTQDADAFVASEKAALEFVERARRSAQRASSTAAELIGNDVTVLTHSRSSTTLSAFIQAKRSGRRFDVIATESRPLMEGRSLAGSLAKENINVTLIADAAAAVMMEKADFVLVGADNLTPGHLTNKIGTRLIALAAREQGVAVYAICDSSKFISSAHTLPEARDPGELWSDPPSGVSLLNRYFEPVPLNYFTSIISEVGMLRPEAASRQAEAKKLLPELAAALQRNYSGFNMLEDKSNQHS